MVIVDGQPLVGLTRLSDRWSRRTSSLTRMRRGSVSCRAPTRPTSTTDWTLYRSGDITVVLKSKLSVQVFIENFPTSS